MTGRSAVRRTAAIVILLTLAAGSLAVVAVHVVLRREAPRPVFGRDLIRVGYAIEAPFAFIADDGAVTGESPEVAREVIRRLGIGRTEWVQTSFPDLIDDLAAGRFDVVAAGMFIDRERARRVLFSRPTFRVREGLLVQAGNPRQIHSYAEAVGRADVRVAVLSGSVEERLLRDLGLPMNRMLTVPDARTGWVAVASRSVDGLALSLPTIRWMARASGAASVEIAEPFEPLADAASGRRGFGAFAFRLDDRRLRDAWDSVLRSFVGSDAHLRVVAPFGFTAAEMPGRVSVADLVAP